jgi:hypothetical protein
LGSRKLPSPVTIADIGISRRKASISAVLQADLQVISDSADGTKQIISASRESSRFIIFESRVKVFIFASKNY